MTIIPFRNEGATLKKSVFAIILVVAVVLAFLLGMLVSKGNQSDNSKASVVGVYKTDSWNGKTGTLVLYEDGTCQYPSGGSATWTLQKNTILITIAAERAKGIITIYFDDSFTEAEAKAKATSIAKLDNVESVNFIEGTNLCKITLIKAETDNKTLDTISNIKGIKIVEHTTTTATDASEHEAKIMENGLVLHGQYFEKVSN